MKGLVSVFPLVALAALCSRPCCADSIKIGDKTLDNVYITENADFYIVRIPSDGSLEKISRKRTDVGHVNRCSDPEARKRLLQQWQEAVAQEDALARAQAEAAQEEARATPQLEALARPQKEARAKAQAEAAQEEALARAQVEAAQEEARAKLPSCVIEYIDASQGWPMFFNRKEGGWSMMEGRIGYIGTAELPGVAKILQIIDSRSMLLEPYSFAADHPKAVMVRGVATSGHVDDGYISITKMLKVIGTIQYTTVIGGSRTVFVLEPFDVEPFRNAIPASMLIN